MKIQPTSRYIRRSGGRGRRSDSPAGRAPVGKRDEKRNRETVRQRWAVCTGTAILVGCLVFRPIVELSTDDVWEFLAETPPPWGGSYDELVQLYRDAAGGECPVVTQKSDVPSCGTTSSRFGCWTCTVVDKDRSLEGFVESGFQGIRTAPRFPRLVGHDSKRSGTAGRRVGGTAKSRPTKMEI